MATSEVPASEAAFRARIGYYLVVWSTGGVIALAAVIIVAAGWGPTNVERTAQLIFTALLPLLGTWVGTVLAFYFSKENFESASRATQDLVRSVSQRLSSTRVTDKGAMIPAATIIKATVPGGQQIDDLTAAEIDGLFEKPGANGQLISRLLIVNQKGACLAILHRSVWMEMQVAGAKQTPAFNVAADKMEKVLKLPYEPRAGTTFKDFITSTIAFVAQTASVADAKAAMEAKPTCQDVIVTVTGKEDEPMLGWISNIDITRLSQA